MSRTTSVLAGLALRRSVGGGSVQHRRPLSYAQVRSSVRSVSGMMAFQRPHCRSIGLFHARGFHGSVQSPEDKNDAFDPTAARQNPEGSIATITKKRNWLLKLVGYYSDESTYMRQSSAMYRSCVYQISDSNIYTELGIEDSFYFRHSLIILHVWLVHQRLRSIGEEVDVQKDLQEQLFDRVWEDTVKRVRTLGVQELSVNKYVRDTQTFSFGAAVAYDHGLANDDHELGSSLFRNLFAGREEIEDEKVLAMVEYVRSQVEHLAAIPSDDIVSGKIDWLPMPGKKETPGDTGDWQEALSEDGRAYWWNTKTRQSTWENPYPADDVATGDTSKK